VDGKRLMLARRPSGGTMTKTNQRRISKRMEMELPVEIRWKSPTGSPKQALGKTGNISGSGLFIEIPVRLHRATSVKIRVLLPPEVTQVPLELLCQGRVVRWNQHGQVQGLGAVIDEYELRPIARTAPGGKRSPRSNKSA
jgi:PilZ domain